MACGRRHEPQKSLLRDLSVISSYVKSTSLRCPSLANTLKPFLRKTTFKFLCHTDERVHYKGHISFFTKQRFNNRRKEICNKHSALALASQASAA